MAILYKANETDFNHLGLGPLDDAVSILVTEERNGMFELEMSYPIEGTRINEIKLDRLIKADAGHNLKGQRFKIIRITKPIDGIVTINAEHVSYLTQDLALKPTVNYSGNASQALNTWKNSIVDINPFIVSSDIITNGNGSWSIKDVNNAREALGGVSGSILETYGGEYRFDNYSIRLMAQRGVNSGALIAYGRNLVDLTQEESIADTFTSVYPYAVYQDAKNKEVLLILPEYFVDSEYVGNYARRKILPVDFSEDEIKDVATLRSRTNSYIKSNGIGIPKVNMQIKYIDLAKTLDYKDLVILEEVNLCDNIFVYFEQLEVNTSAKIIKTVWDDLLKQYDSIEVGEAKSSLSNSINATVDGKLETIVKRVNTIQLTADGLNVIYRGPEEPAPGNIGDLWYEPDGIYENMYQWDGSIWKLMLSTRDLDSVSEEVKKHTDEIATVAKSANDAVDKADQAIIDAGFAQVDSNAAIINAGNAITIANTAQTSADTAMLSAQTAVTNSGTALTNAQTALTRVGAVEDETGDLKTSYDLLTQTVGLKADKTTVNGINQTVTQQALDISANVTAVGLKADKIVVDTINSTVASHTLSIKATADSLATKAEKTLVDSINGTVATHTSQIKVNADGLALKADSSFVNTIKGTVDTHTTQIKATSDGLALKAESSLVNTINGTVNTHTGQISANSTAINARLTSAQVDSLVTGKNYVNQTTLNATSSSLNASITQVSTDLSNLEIGGRNYFKKNSALERFSTRFLNLDTFDILEDLVGEEVTVSFDIKITTTGISRSLSVYHYQGSGIAPSGGMSIIPTTTWKRYSYTSKVVSYSVPAGYSQGSIALYDPVGNNSYIIKNIQIEKGNKNTDYNMAPEEMATLEKFTTLNATVGGIQTTVGTKASQTQVTQLATQITTKVESSTYNSKMTQLDSSINLRLESSKVISQINLSTEGILLQGKRIQLDGDVTMTNAFADKIRTIDLIATRITSGTLNASVVNLINMNASNIITGTVKGSNSSWNLNTGSMEFKNASTLDLLTFNQGRIEFQNGDQGRYLEYNAEGLHLVPFATNYGTSKNTMLHLEGGGTGSYQYIQFTSGSGISQRVEAVGDEMVLHHGINGSLHVRRYGQDDTTGKIITAKYETRHSTGKTLIIARDTIDTERSGSANIYIRPSGAGVVVSGNDTGERYNVVASDFVKQSTRTSKTDIKPIETKGLDVINRLLPVSYKKKDKIARGIIETELGFISEDNPEIATLDGLGVYDSHINAYLVKAVQELSEKIKLLESGI